MNVEMQWSTTISSTNVDNQSATTNKLPSFLKYLFEILPVLGTLLIAAGFLLLLGMWIQRAKSYFLKSKPSDEPPPYKEFKIDVFLEDPPSYQEAVNRLPEPTNLG